MTNSQARKSDIKQTERGGERDVRSSSTLYKHKLSMQHLCSLLPNTKSVLCSDAALILESTPNIRFNRSINYHVYSKGLIIQCLIPCLLYFYFMSFNCNLYICKTILLQNIQSMANLVVYLAISIQRKYVGLQYFSFL